MKKYVIANWKSNKQADAVRTWFEGFKHSVVNLNSEKVNVVVAPPFPLVSAVKTELSSASASVLSQVELAVQDISPFPAGSYTGAVAASNLTGLGVRYAILGHSERRKYFHETHQDVGNKVVQCIEAGITPVVCVDDEYIASQAAAIPAELLSQCVVAYEELGAIGTGDNEDPDKVKQVVQRIKVVFNQVPVLYGGSVKPGNVDQYASICDGVLVGGSSLDPQAFAQIVTSFMVAQ